MKKVFQKFSDIIEVLTVICFVALALLVLLQIFCRWGNIGLGWTDEIISCLTTWMVFLGYCYMCQRDEHIAISMLQDALPEKARTVLRLIVRVVNILGGAAIFYGGLQWTATTASKLTSNLQIHYNIWYDSLWICSIIFVIFAAEKLVENIVALFKK